jgi:hypothetical protein
MVATPEEAPMDSARIAQKLRAHIIQFSGELSRGFPKVASRLVREMTLLILALSDIDKKSAEKMEPLAPVWDGSEKTKAWGYWTLNIIGAETASALGLGSPRRPSLNACSSIYNNFGVSPV